MVATELKSLRGESAYVGHKFFPAGDVEKKSHDRTCVRFFVVHVGRRLNSMLLYMSLLSERELCHCSRLLVRHSRKKSGLDLLTHYNFIIVTMSHNVWSWESTFVSSSNIKKK